MARVSTDVEAPAHVLASSLAQELVHVYDLLEIALHLAGHHLENTRTNLADQSDFWNRLHTLDRFLDYAEDSPFEDWIRDVGTPPIDPPTVHRRSEIEGLRQRLVSVEG
jgi:hypothetical protein